MRHIFFCAFSGIDIAGYIKISFFISFSSEIWKIMVEGFIIERNWGRGVWFEGFQDWNKSAIVKNYNILLMHSKENIAVTGPLERV